MNEALIQWVKRNIKEKNIKLSLKLEKIVRDRSGRGNDARYFRCFLGNHDVSIMVANLIGRNYSKTNGKTHNCVIVHGCGMDMAFWLQSEVYRAAYRAGCPEMFDDQQYIWLN